MHEWLVCEGIVLKCQMTNKSCKVKLHFLGLFFKHLLRVHWSCFLNLKDFFMLIEIYKTQKVPLIIIIWLAFMAIKISILL